MGVRAEPSLIHTLPSACGLRSLQVSLSLVNVVVSGSPKVLTLPGQCLWSQAPLRYALSPTPYLGFGLDTPHSPAEVPDSWVDRRLELLVQENSPNVTRGSFSF